MHARELRVVSPLKKCIMEYLIKLESEVGLSQVEAFYELVCKAHAKQFTY